MRASYLITFQFSEFRYDLGSLIAVLNFVISTSLISRGIELNDPGSKQ